MIKKLSSSRFGLVAASTTALVLMGGIGTATAAHLIGSDDIADQSIRSRDIDTQGVGTSEIRDGSILLKDMSDVTRKALSVAGPQGDKGEKGEPGLTGPAGPQGERGAPGAAGGGAMAAGDPGEGSLSQVGAQVASVDFDAPSDGVAFVSVQSEFNAQAASGFVVARITEDDQMVKYMDWDAGDADGLYDQSQSGFVVVPVSAGEHTFGLTLQEYTTPNSDYNAAQVAVQFVPNNGSSSTIMPFPKVAKSPNR